MNTTGQGNKKACGSKAEMVESTFEDTASVKRALVIRTLAKAQAVLATP